MTTRDPYSKFLPASQIKRILQVQCAETGWSMDLFLVAATILFIAIFFWIASKNKARSTRRTLFRRREKLFTASERSFLGVLDQASRGRYRVFGKVRVADVIAPVKGLDRSTWTSVFNRIKSKHFDFVLCDPQSLEVRAVIELNDKSHSRRRRLERDELVGRACSDAGIVLRFVRTQRTYSVEMVRKLVDDIGLESHTSRHGPDGARKEPTLS